MKYILLLFGILGLTPKIYAQNKKPKSKIEKVFIEYKGKKVKARQLTVSSEIPMDLDSAWANVKTPALLEFVAKGMIRFKAVESKFPKKWEVGQTYGAKVWNHDVIMKELDNGLIHYEDSITIYGGVMTGLITSFAKRFYIHRQKRWQIVAKEELNFRE